MPSDTETAYAALERLGTGAGRIDPPHHNDAERWTTEAVGVSFLWDVYHGRDEMPEGVTFTSRPSDKAREA